MVCQGPKNRLDGERRALIHHSPAIRIASLRQECDSHARALGQAMRTYAGVRRTAHRSLEERLKDLDPLSVLHRGYSITLRLPEKEVVRRASAIAGGDRVQILLGEGKLVCRVEEVSEDGGIAFDRGDGSI